jgi:hypothetical protein
MLYLWRIRIEKRMKPKLDLSHYITCWGMCLLFLAISSQIAAQEDVKRIARDSLRVETGIQEEISLSLPPVDEISGVPLPQSAVSDSLFRLSLDKPLVPPYYINPSPMFRGDYSTGGVLREFHHGILYGTGGQTTLPGIGRMNEVSLGYMHRFNSQWSLQVGVEDEYAFCCGTVFRNFGHIDVPPFGSHCL